MLQDKINPELFMTTYLCPNCAQHYYEMHNKNQTVPIPDEYKPVLAAKQATKRYSKKLEIYEKIKNETDEAKIAHLKQDEFYDPNFNPSTSEMY